MKEARQLLHRAAQLETLRAAQPEALRAAQPEAQLEAEPVSLWAVRLVLRQPAR